MPVDEKQVLVPCMSPILWESRPISFDIPLLHLSFFGTLMSCQYSWDFPVSGQITALDLPGCNFSFPVIWSMTAQSSTTGSTRDAGLLDVEVSVLIVAT